jgi:hypothetical protein
MAYKIVVFWISPRGDINEGILAKQKWLNNEFFKYLARYQGDDKFDWVS